MSFLVPNHNVPESFLHSYRVPPASQQPGLGVGAGLPNVLLPFEVPCSIEGLIQTLNFNQDQAVQLQRVVSSRDLRYLKSVTDLCKSDENTFGLMLQLYVTGNPRECVISLAQNLSGVDEATMTFLSSVDVPGRAALASFLMALQDSFPKSRPDSRRPETPRRSRTNSEVNALSPGSVAFSSPSPSSAGSGERHPCPGADCEREFKYFGSLENHVMTTHTSLQSDPHWNALRQSHKSARKRKRIVMEDPTPQDTLLVGSMIEDMEVSDGVVNPSPHGFNQQLDDDHAITAHQRSESWLRPQTALQEFNLQRNNLESGFPSQTVWDNHASHVLPPSRIRRVVPGLRVVPPDSAPNLGFNQLPYEYNGQVMFANVNSTAEVFESTELRNSFPQQQ
jgi:hypothetical protein